DEVAIYGKALTAAQIQAHHNAAAASADATAPGAATLSLSGATGSSIAVGWTAPGDDGASGTVTRYELRYATAAISDASFPSATPVTTAPAPAAGGTAQGVTVTGLAPSTTYYFALRS